MDPSRLFWSERTSSSRTSSRCLYAISIIESCKAAYQLCNFVYFCFSFPPTAAMPKALRSKTLQSPPTRSAHKRRRGLCNLCNNLDPRGHTATAYDAESNSRAGASLTLVVDGLKLQSAAEFGCKFCLLVAQALDAFLKDWRASRGRIIIDLLEGKPIKVLIEGIKCKGVNLEIYMPHGKTFLSPIRVLTALKSHTANLLVIYF